MNFTYNILLKNSYLYYSINNSFRWKLILEIQRHPRHPIEVTNDQYELMTEYDLMVNHNINDTVSSSEFFNPEEEIIQ